MTPAERIEQGIDKWWSMPQEFPTRAEFILDALCPKGERIVLDRTGDTDRLIRQVRVGGHCAEHHTAGLMFADGCEAAQGRPQDCVLVPTWVDSPEGGKQ